MNPRRIYVTAAVSLAAHALLLAIPVRHPVDGSAAAAARPFVATLVDPPAKVEPVREPVAPPAKPVPLTRPKVVAVAPVMTIPVEKPAAAPIEIPVEQPAEPKFDMLAMINARRERRQQYEEAVLRAERARSAAPSENDPNAALQRNLDSLKPDNDGTGGVFTILSIGTRAGEFSFNGWRPETHRRWREVIEVDAGPGGNVELAIVQRMIQLIRGHYTGDFTWHSYRLGKTLVLSARPEDNGELEQFLLREFFGTPTLAHKK